MTAEATTKRSGILDAEDCLEAEPLFTLSEALPTEEGWYWHKPNPHYLLPYILEVRMQYHRMNCGTVRSISPPVPCVWYEGGKAWMPVADIGGLWSQRIPEPRE